jgi:hypothetical protein
MLLHDCRHVLSALLKSPGFLLLLVGCVNLANLVPVRASNRTRE